MQQIFIDNLKFYRKKKKLSQKDLSIMLDKGFNYINSIEGGTSFPPPAVIDQIANFLEVDVEQLFSNPLNAQKSSQTFCTQLKQKLQTELSERILKDINDVCDDL